jgi:hypothetical protein
MHRVTEIVTKPSWGELIDMVHSHILLEQHGYESPDLSYGTRTEAREGNRRRSIWFGHNDLQEGTEANWFAWQAGAGSAHSIAGAA